MTRVRSVFSTYGLARTVLASTLALASQPTSYPRLIAGILCIYWALGVLLPERERC